MNRHAEYPWWRQAVIYQIYPKSFQDSGARGTGDLRGVIQRLDYLQQLGVDALWLTPIYVSPQIDNGYDVADYTAIDPAYGTMADFDHLLAETHRRGMRMVLDMVFNHTSTEHAWFKRAEAGEQPYVDFYIWRDGVPGTPPNNWQSKFGGSAWAWNERRQQYYLHLYAPEQADLNWENPAVREALKQVCHFWAARGVDGLRLDVINLVSKHQDFSDDLPGHDGRRFYTDGPRIHDYLQEFNRDVFTPRGLMTVGEMSSTTLANCQRYASLAQNELSMTFNFHHLKVDYPQGDKWTLAAPDFVQLKAIFAEWQRGMHDVAWNALFWCNHDQPRIVTRFGDEGALRIASAKCFAMLLHGMQGTPYIYQGEELGMTNPHFTRIEQYQDIESHNIHAAWLAQGKPEAAILAILASKSRDNSRSPMLWDSSANAGFTRGEPWIGVADNYTLINAANALLDSNSVFYGYQTLIRLRKRYAIFTEGDYQDLAPQASHIWCYRRNSPRESLLVVANLSHSAQPLLLPEVEGNWQVLMRNYNEASPPGALTYLRPFEAVYYYQS